jgi:hypothetical protein
MANTSAIQETYTDNGYDLLRLEVSSNSGGDPFDLKDVFLEIAIYESVFDDKMYGEILIKDALNLGETIPLVGNEKIYIEYKTKNTKNKPVSISGHIVAPMGKARAEGEKVEIYKLQFISEVQFANRFRRIASSYSGEITTIAAKIFADNFKEEYLKNFFFNEMTTTKHKFVIPYWSPLFTLSWLAQRAYSATPSYFIFYEDVDGFHFKNLLKAIDEDPVMNYNVEPKSGGNLGNVNSYMSKVQDYSVTSFFDRLEEQAGGMYSSALLTHDITKKTYVPYQYDYKSGFAKSNHLNRYPLYPEQSQMADVMFKSNVCFRNLLPVQTKRFERIEDNEKLENYFLDRNSMQKQFTTFRVTITVPGISTLRLLDTVYFRIPRIGYMDENRTDWEDPYLTGKYLVMSIRTVINKLSGYRTTIEMSKDSLIKGIPDKFEKKSLNVL